MFFFFFFFSSRRRHTRFDCDWSSDVCSSDLAPEGRRRNADHVRRLAVEPHDAADRAAVAAEVVHPEPVAEHQDRKSTRLNSSHSQISYAVFCLKKKNKKKYKKSSTNTDITHH